MRRRTPQTRSVVVENRAKPADTGARHEHRQKKSNQPAPVCVLSTFPSESSLQGTRIFSSLFSASLHLQSNTTAAPVQPDRERHRNLSRTRARWEGMTWMIGNRVYKSGSLFSIFLWHRCFFSLPQVVVDGDGIHADRHGLSGDDGELLPVRVVLVQLIDHLLADALGSSACQLYDLLCVGEVGVKGPELTAAVTKQYHQMVRLAFLQLLVRKKAKKDSETV